MSLNGICFHYEIDRSYKSGRYGWKSPGCISVSENSVIFMGIRSQQNEDGSGYTNQSKCVLKFIRNDAKERFINGELKILNALRDCPSVLHILDIIYDIGDFTEQHPTKFKDISNDAEEGYFCVAEEWIQGRTLEEYCLRFAEKFDKKPLIEFTENGLRSYLQDYSFNEKVQANEAYRNYEICIQYQNRMLDFMQRLCAILEYLAEQKHILHLNLKPEHIMITDADEEPILIGFENAQFMDDSNTASVTIPPHTTYGTVGFAAPEAINQEKSKTRADLSVESDIFSLGAAFWECMYMPVLFTKRTEFARKYINDFPNNPFYQLSVFSVNTYCDRDLSDTLPFFHEQIGKIIQKCTKEREKGYRKNALKYYNSYTDLREDIEAVRFDAPAIYPLKRTNVRIWAAVFGVFAAMALVFGICTLTLTLLRKPLAHSKITSITQNYTPADHRQLTDAVMNYLSYVQTDEEKHQAYTDMYSIFQSESEQLEIRHAESLIMVLARMDHVRDSDFITENLDNILVNIRADDLFSTVDLIMENNFQYESQGSVIMNALYRSHHMDGLTESYELLRSLMKGHDRKYDPLIYQLAAELNTNSRLKKLSEEIMNTKVESMTQMKELQNQAKNLITELDDIMEKLEKEAGEYRKEG